jgi:serine/threonine protein kinase
MREQTGEAASIACGMFHRVEALQSVRGISVMPNRIGQHLGNYRLLRLLGRGGFAEVYLGEHVFLKRRAALKVLYTTLEDEDIDLFLSEAQLLARLNHPHIVRVHDFAVEENIPFLAMDYALGGSLRQHHPRGSFLSLAATATYVNQVAEALQYAHNHQVIHRDVKPENMLVGANQEVLLSDFGISLFTPSHEQLSTQYMAGTVPYMAPEQIRGKPGFASDQYALGIVVYEWLCGVRPFEGSMTEVIVQHLTMPPPLLREKDPSLPEAVEAVVLKALAKEPEDRYGSVTQFAQALEDASAMSLLNLRSDTKVTAQLGPIASPPSFLTRVPTIRVCISASHADHAFVAQLKTDLQKRGITGLDENPDLTQNMLEQEDLVRQVIRAADVVLVVLTPDTRSSRTIKTHVRIAGLYQRRLLFLLARGDEISTALPGEWSKASEIDMIDARETHYEQALEELMASLHKEETPQSESVLPESSFVPRNPYKGLNAFKEDDATDFFGREALTQELVEQVKRLLATEHSERLPARLLTVIGPSGSGKSSVVMAGLLPQLRHGAVTGSEQWIYLSPMLPGVQALEALALTFTPYLPERSVKSIREDLEDESARGLHRLSVQLVKTPGQQVVLVIDQFEELFTLTGDEVERQQFIDVLVTAMTEPHGAVVVLLTLRADFYDRPMAYPALHQLIETHQKAVLPMAMEDLRAVIKGPAVLPDVQLSFEGNLVGDLLFEMQGHVGALPLLQFTLDQLFARRSGHQLTLVAYKELGGVKGAVAKYAERTYDSLPSEEHRKLARVLFLRLIDPGAAAQDTTRRRIPRSELVLSDVKETVMMEEIVRAFTTARLLTTNTVSGVATVELSHEAVIHEWMRLTDWLDEAREDVHHQQIISEDASEWERHGRSKDRLYRGTQLKEAQAWARRNTTSAMETSFLRASAALRLRSLLLGVLVVLLLLSTMVAAGWFLLDQPPPRDPTRVTTLVDGAPGSLRWAIENAPAGSTITFAPDLRGSLMLTRGDLELTKNLRLRGPGADMLAISSGSQGYIVYVTQSASVSITGLAFKDSIITNNAFSFITNEGTLSLTNDIISGNKVYLSDINFSPRGGGGISNSGTLILANSTVSDNLTSSDSGGGGITNFNSGILTLTNSMVSGNAASFGSGGGILNFGSLTLSNSTVSGNVAQHDGGGISDIDGGSLTLTNSTVSGNTAQHDGGGIYHLDVFFPLEAALSSGSLALTNSTVSGNTAQNDGGGINNNSYNDTILSFCTIYGNKAAKGGGINVEKSFISNGNQKIASFPVHITSSILAGNSSVVGLDIAGQIITGGYNLIQHMSGYMITDPDQMHSTDHSGIPLDKIRIDSVLRSNGGNTLTHALLPGSTAIDIIPLNVCHINGISTDQRDMKRPDGNESACDMGAFETSL